MAWLVIIAGLGAEGSIWEGVSEGVRWVIEGYGLVWSTLVASYG